MKHLRTPIVPLLLAVAIPAAAHNGPSFPIVSDRRVGPCVISVWTHPDVGIGTFFVIVDAPKGGSIPKDLKIDIAVQPVSGRLPEKRYGGRLADQRGQLLYNYAIPFDAQELWRIRTIVESSQGGGEAVANVKVTPPGPQPWDLLWYASPFAAVGYLWIRALIRKRKPKPA